MATGYERNIAIAFKGLCDALASEEWDLVDMFAKDLASVAGSITSLRNDAARKAAEARIKAARLAAEEGSKRG